MNKVEVSRCMVGVFGMQACAESDATDKEILAVCNIENPSGTSNGWSTVVRDNNLEDMDLTPNCAPVACEDDPDRLHFLVIC